MQQFSRLLFLVLALILPRMSLAETPGTAEEPLSAIAERHCRSAGIAARQLRECARALVTDAEQLAQATDERLRQALDAIRAGDLAGAEKQLLAFVENDATGAGPKDLALAHAALGALHAAGREASAIEFYEKARELDRGDLSHTLHLAQIHDRKNDLPRAQALYQEVADATTADDPQAAYWKAGAVLGLGDVARKRGQLDEADAHYRRALEMFAGLGRRHDEADVNAALGHVALQRGQFAEARDRLSRALAFYEEIGQTDAIAGLSINLGAAEMAAGNDAAAEGHLKRALKIAEETGNRGMQLAAHVNLGRVTGRLGRPGESESHNLAALKLAEELKDPELEGFILLRIAVLRDNSGDMVEACKRYAQAADRMAAASVPEERNVARKLLAVRCGVQQANRPGAKAATPASAKAQNLPGFSALIDEAGQAVILR